MKERAWAEPCCSNCDHWKNMVKFKHQAGNIHTVKECHLGDDKNRKIFPSNEPYPETMDNHWCDSHTHN